MVTGFGSAGDWFIPATSGYDGNKIEFNFGKWIFFQQQKSQVKEVMRVE